MTVRDLGQTDFNVIMKCFLSSFEGYFVKMPTDYNYYRQRWEVAKVRYDLSYGMFDDDKLVGFIIHAIDERSGHLTAFNTGTGVIPEYRGKRIVKSIYDYALPQLKEKGITKSTLEVITENQKAIKAYEGVGFKICKHFKCYNGTLLVKEKEHVLREVTFHDMNWSTLPNQEHYSWDNQSRCLESGKYHYYQVSNNNDVVAFFVINSDNGYVAQLDVLKESNSEWKTLFSAITSISNTIKINNIDNRLIEKLEAVESVGLNNAVDQYEMELFIR